MLAEIDASNLRKSFVACGIAAGCTSMSYVIGEGLIGIVVRAIHQLSLNAEVHKAAPETDMCLNICPDMQTLTYLPQMILMALSVILLVGMGIFFALCLIGLPVQYIMQKRKLTGLLWHVLPATVIGSLLIRLTFSATENTMIGWLELIYPGFISGLVFWFIRRPDRDDRLQIIENTSLAR